MASYRLVAMKGMDIGTITSCQKIKLYCSIGISHDETVPDQPLQLLRCPDWGCAEHMKVSADGLLMFTSHDKKVCFWAMPDCSVTYLEAHCGETKLITCRGLPHSAAALALVYDFALALAVKQQVYLWPLYPAQLRIGKKPSLLTHSADVLLLANDGNKLLTGCSNSMLTMYWLQWMDGAEDVQVNIDWRLNVTDDEGRCRESRRSTVTLLPERWSNSFVATHHIREALAELIYMMDSVGGMQVRSWTIQSNFIKKIVLDQESREKRHKFIRNPIENRQESKVMAALRNFSRASGFNVLDLVKAREYYTGPDFLEKARRDRERGSAALSGAL
ncbi:unnamed protein product [Symbiodinium natans]|uniref:Uncharacterized protein n=1 Tax=Symbiodinium natans TaxID=878477 RepID=A0A812QSY8_9DINO|nr:unnamed protein product [Symbiodinium natans]